MAEKLGQRKADKSTEDTPDDHKEPAGKLCFFVAPIGSEGTDIRRRSNQVFKHIVQRAAAACGLVAIRGDHIQEPGPITSQVIEHVLSDAVVVADLTGWNPKVFYELAIRHAIRKPYVQIIAAGERPPFDVAGIRTIEFG
jgi:hypothetical protein